MITKRRSEHLRLSQCRILEKAQGFTQHAVAKSLGSRRCPSAPRLFIATQFSLALSLFQLHLISWQAKDGVVTIENSRLVQVSVHSRGINDSSSGSEVYLACLCNKENLSDQSETSTTRVQTLCAA